MVTCTNVFWATVDWKVSPGLSSFAASRLCHSPIARNNFLQRLIGGWGGHVQYWRIDHMWESLPLIALIFLKGRWDMRRLSLCCSIGLGGVFDPRSHTRYPPYELVNRSWYVSFCWAWYQEKRGPCRSIPDEKSQDNYCAWRGSFICISNWVPAMPGTHVRDPESPPPYQFLFSAKFSIYRLVLSRWFCL
jgi:hypothetical protein